LVSGAATFSSTVSATKVILSLGAEQAELTSAFNNDFKLTNSGAFRIINNANTVALLTVTNAGAATFSSTITAGDAIAVSSGSTGTGNSFYLYNSSTVKQWNIVNIGSGVSGRSGNFEINNNSFDIFSITQTGRIGIGTTSPGYMFHVQGNLTSSQSLFYNTLNAGTEANLLLRLGSNCSNTNSTYISGGIFGVADKFYIYGNGNMVNANNSYGPLSDIKLKENITDATPKLDKLMQVRIVNYNLISDPELKQIGVVAQELEKVFPGLVDEHIDKDEEGNLLDTTTKSVKMSVFVPILIKAVQELNERLNKAGL
jgi:hypothetical protein